MAFSEDMESVGKFAPRKLWVLFTTILRIWWARFRYRTPVLYYPPSGPNKVPVLRDIDPAGRHALDLQQSGLPLPCRWCFNL